MPEEFDREAERSLGWRERSALIIAEIIAQNAGKEESEIRSALDKASPFPERMYYPRKVWLEEVARQLDATFDKGNRKD